MYDVCPDQRLESPENPHQDIINRLAYLTDERFVVEFCKDKAIFFPDEWRELLDIYDEAIMELTDIIEGKA